MSNPATPIQSPRPRIAPSAVPEAFFKKYCIDTKPDPKGGVIGRIKCPPHVFMRFNPFDKDGSKISFFLNDPSCHGAELILEAQATQQGTIRLSYEICSRSGIGAGLTIHKPFCEDLIGDFVRDYVDCQQ